MDSQPPPGTASNPTAASMSAPSGVPANAVRPSMPQILQQMNTKGFHDFLVGRLHNLDLRGWPLHLRSMETASWRLEPGVPWAPEDQESLLVLSAHGVKIEDIARLFFEGRTVDECQAEIEKFKAGVPMESIEEIGQRSEGDIESSKAALPETPSTRAVLAVPSSTPSVATSFTKRLIEVSSSASRARSNKPYTDSRKDWDQADRDTVWAAVQRGLTPREIQAQYLPFRSESAIQTRMSKERALRGMQAAPTKWSNKDTNLVLKLTSEGHDFEDIAPRLSRERTPQQIEARYRNLKKQAKASRMSVEANLIENDDGDVEMGEGEGEESMQVDAAGDDGSEYTEDSPQAVQTPPKLRTARKTVTSTSDSLSKDSLKKTPLSIATIRTRLLGSIDAKYLSSDDKKELRKALNKTGWPTRFTSVEEYNSPLPAKVGLRWTEQDVEALRCIRESVPSLPYKFIENFFPGRSTTAIRNLYNTKVNPGPNYNGRKK
ncbi:hypothetical protein P171DRAFT_502210 [Karstenula rhodostoma CBS 690.94]|uniref:Myb-like domain-containing protein n=1 Tax=Karstenula rhodostoma CBS 690.94 TaxID=1392251 RepID=A0A9P4P7Y3_9PLEO|nr:hypothetical protein P171DRAFT_502210 [Karstenula rhodostoma CBS 690.94]